MSYTVTGCDTRGTVYGVAVHGGCFRPIEIVTAIRAIHKGIINPGTAMRAIVVERTVAITAVLDPDNIMGAASITLKCMLHLTLKRMPFL